MRRTLAAVGAAVMLAAALTGCASDTPGPDPQITAWCSQFASTVKGWIPESVGGTAPMNALPSNGDIQHQAIELQNDAPLVLRIPMAPLVQDTLNVDGAAIVRDAATVATTCTNLAG